MKQRMFLICIMAGFAFQTISAAGNAEVQQPAGSSVVIDDLGRHVMLPQEPGVVIGLASSAIEGIYNLGISPAARVEEYRIRSEAAALPSIGRSAAPDLEKIHALQPDLIIALTRQHGSLAESLEATGAAVYFINPDSGDDRPMVLMAERIGALLGKEAEAAEYIQSVEEHAALYAARIQEKTAFRTALVLQDGDTVMAAQRSSGYGSILSYLGLVNIVPEGLPGSSRSPFIAFDAESIAAADPDIIFVCAPTANEQNSRRVLQKYLDNPVYSGLSAVKNGSFLILPFEVNTNRAKAVDMIAITASVLLEALAD